MCSRPRALPAMDSCPFPSQGRSHPSCWQCLRWHSEADKLLALSWLLNGNSAGEQNERPRGWEHGLEQTSGVRADGHISPAKEQPLAPSAHHRPPIQPQPFQFSLRASDSCSRGNCAAGARGAQPSPPFHYPRAPTPFVFPGNFIAGAQTRSHQRSLSLGWHGRQWEADTPPSTKGCISILITNVLAPCRTPASRFPSVFPLLPPASPGVGCTIASPFPPLAACADRSDPALPRSAFPSKQRGQRGAGLVFLPCSVISLFHAPHQDTTAVMGQQRFRSCQEGVFLSVSFSWVCALEHSQACTRAESSFQQDAVKGGRRGLS